MTPNTLLPEPFTLPVLVVSLIVVLFIAVSAAEYRPVLLDGDDPHERYFGSWAWHFLQALLIGTLFVFAADNVIINGAGSVNLVELGSAIVFVVILVMLPFVSKVLFPGGASLEVLEKALPETKDLDARTDYAMLALSTAGQLIGEACAEVATQYALGNLNSKQKAMLAARIVVGVTDAVSPFVRPPAPGASTYATVVKTSVPEPPVVPKKNDAPETPADSADDPPKGTPDAEPLRISAWRIGSDAGQTVLQFWLGWPLDEVSNLVGLSFPTGPDPASTTLKTGQLLNFANISEILRPPSANGNAYQGIAILPLCANGRVRGVLQVERAAAASFGGSQIALARNLAALYAIALSG